MIQRFVKSFQLPPHFNVNILKVTPLSRNRFTGKCFELYHSPRVDFPTKYKIDEAVKSIKNNGFYSNHYGNKGRGVYLSSNARYQYMWLGYSTPIMICDVQYIENNNQVKRFRSEVPPGYEYVVSDPKLIIPKYLVEYQVNGPFKELLINGNTIYTPHGHFGCEICDSRKCRCDCELEPTFYPPENTLIY